MTELSNGNIVVAWKDESEENGDTSDYSVKAQVLDANGNRIGGEFLVNTSTAGGQQMPSIAALANGSFIVTWTDEAAREASQDDARQGADLLGRQSRGEYRGEAQSRG